MDTDSLNDELVFGLDNADCNGNDGQLFPHSTSAVQHAEVAFNPHWQKVTSNAQLDRDADKAEIVRLKDELLKAMTEIQTLRDCNTKLNDRIQSKTPSKGLNPNETKSKIVSRLQKELEERILFCENMSGKLKTYRLKYKNAKKALSDVMINPETIQAERVRQLEAENRKLIKEIAMQLSFKMKEQSRENSRSVLDSRQHGSSLILEKLKSKAIKVEGDAKRIVDTVSEIKEIFRDLAVSTPSTSLQDDEKPFLEISQIEEEGTLGKRQDIMFDQEDSQSSLKSEIESRKSFPRSSDRSMEERSQSQGSIAKNLGMQLEQVLSPMILLDCIAISPCELYTSFETKYSTTQNVTVDLISKRKSRRTSSSEEESSLSSKDSGKEFIPQIDKRIKQLNKNPTLKIRHFGNQIKTTQPIMPVTISAKQLEKPILNKLDIPSFLFQRPILISSAQVEPSKPTNAQQAIWINQPSEALQSEIFSKNPTKEENHGSSFFDRAWTICSKLDIANPQKIRKEIFSILEEFMKITRNSVSKKGDSVIDLLMQHQIQSQRYSVKNVINGRDYQGILHTDVNLTFVFQSVFFLIVVSFFESSLNQDETSVFDHLQNYRNDCGFLVDKFDRLKDILKLSTKNTQNNKPGTRNPKTSEKGHHFALLKIVFDHLILSTERQVYSSDNDDFFSSHLLAQKQNLVEITNTARYVMEKIARSSAEITFSEGLLDLLSAFYKLFQVCKYLDMKFNKAFYDVFRGFFSSRKYRNTSQQVIACLILRQLSSVQ